MPRLKSISGDELVKFFTSHGFLVLNQHGSHIKLRCIVDDRKQTLIIPNHTPLRIGTLRAIYIQALAYMPDDVLRAYFYMK